jgi:hypothetical protein
MNETLVKYLAGILDADGSVNFNFVNPTKDERNLCNLSLKISLSSSDAIDVHGFVMRLPELTGFGTSSPFGEKEQFNRWTVTSRRDLEMLVPRLVKHMAVKARHLQRMLDKWKEKRGVFLSEAEREGLLEFSRSSRADAGPLKPKNFPSWAWLAGYLDGNGSYRAGLCKSGKYKGNQYFRMQCSVHASCHKGDVAVLEFIQKAHGGYIKPHSLSENCMVWERNLGKSQHSFAVRFLPKLVRHSHLKRHKIEQMLSFHHQQRPSVLTSAEEATA